MSLYKNLNKKKAAGTSKSKKDSTISPKAYANMKAGFPKKKAKKKWSLDFSWHVASLPTSVAAVSSTTTKKSFTLNWPVRIKWKT